MTCPCNFVAASPKLAIKPTSPESIVAKTATRSFAPFLRRGPEEESVGKKVLKSIRFETARAGVQAGLLQSLIAEWSKFEQFSVAIPMLGADQDALLAAGHKPVPSQWIDTDKKRVQAR